VGVLFRTEPLHKENPGTWEFGELKKLYIELYCILLSMTQEERIARLIERLEFHLMIEDSYLKMLSLRGGDDDRRGI
jgi:hypothetical protein